MKIRTAVLADTGLLVELRLDFLRMMNPALSGEAKRAIRMQLADYYPRHIPAGDFIAVLAEEERRVLAAAFMVFAERPAGPAFPSGKTATLLNVMTYPSCRGRGYATLLVEESIRCAADRGVTAIDLNATPMGETLYRRLGFEPVADTAMRLRL